MRFLKKVRSRADLDAGPQSRSSVRRPLIEKKPLYIVTLFMVLSLAINWYGGYFLTYVVSFKTDPSVVEPRSETSFEWGQIDPTPHLVYHPCFENFQCARLELPMDWNNTDEGAAKIALAVIRLPAKVPITDARYGGPVIMNPGGPGNSGVAEVLADGKRMQEIVDSEQPADIGTGNSTAAAAKYFDIVSFDPRGINNTTPPFSCFRHSAARKKWLAQAAAEGIVGSSEVAFDTYWARSSALGVTCSQAAEESRSNGEEWIGYYMNTTPVVADMVELIERHGEWREKQTEEFLQTAPQTLDGDAIQLRNRWQKGEEKLLYWGISYGTVLGMTFAAMQPGRIQRALIDGVCDTSDYYGGLWLKNVQDADHAFDAFFKYCQEAGPTGCALAGGSPEEIQARVDELIANLKTSPIPVAASTSRGPDIITYSDVKTTITSSLYEPMEQFGFLAELLADISLNNGSSFADYKYQSASPEPILGNNKYEAQSSIVCTDGETIDGISKDEIRQYLQTLRGQSKTIGEEWSHIRLSCIRWNTRPAWKFDGPIAGNTSHPLLFIGNTYDPVTPLQNALQMAPRFPDSVVLHQNSVGHCSYTGPSSCTNQTIRRYFQTGDLPRPGTICEVDKRPFGLPRRE